MSEQTPRRRRADRAYTPEENEAAPCRRRMNADEPPAPTPNARVLFARGVHPVPCGGFVRHHAARHPVRCASGHAVRAPRNGNSVCRRWANRCAGRCNCSVLRARISLPPSAWSRRLAEHAAGCAAVAAKADSTFGAVCLPLPACIRPLCRGGRNAALAGVSAPPVQLGGVLSAAWGLTFAGVHLMSRGSTGALFAGFVLLLAPLAWGIVLGWAAANALHRHCFFSRWTFVALEVLCGLGIAARCWGIPLHCLRRRRCRCGCSLALCSCAARRCNPSPLPPSSISSSA